jgi:hypothetical protein
MKASKFPKITGAVCLASSALVLPPWFAAQASKGGGLLPSSSLDFTRLSAGWLKNKGRYAGITYA